MITANVVATTVLNENTPFLGFRFEEFSEINTQNITISYEGRLKVLTENFMINNSMLTQNVEGEATG